MSQPDPINRMSKIARLGLGSMFSAIVTLALVDSSAAADSGLGGCAVSAVVQTYNFVRSG